jgi:hypothetical protein
MDIVSKEDKAKPGPGIYESPSKFGDNAQKVSMMGKGAEKREDDKPGPGAYNAKDFLTKDNIQAHSISKSKRADIVGRDAKELPGPGNYSDGKEFGKDAIAFKMGGKAKETNRNDSPGPGNYDPNDNLVRYASPQHGISKTSRSDLVSADKKSLPGPGVYDQSAMNIGKSGPSFKMQGKPVP